MKAYRPTNCFKLLSDAGSSVVSDSKATLKEMQNYVRFLQKSSAIGPEIQYWTVPDVAQPTTAALDAVFGTVNEAAAYSAAQHIRYGIANRSLGPTNYQFNLTGCWSGTIPYVFSFKVDTTGVCISLAAFSTTSTLAANPAVISIPANENVVLLAPTQDKSYPLIVRKGASSFMGNVTVKTDGSIVIYAGLGTETFAPSVDGELVGFSATDVFYVLN